MRRRCQEIVEDLQDVICTALERVDSGFRFREDLWQRRGGGGGRSRVLEGGEVFEKAGVNTSAVHGELPPELAATLEGQGTAFFATGISLVLHPRNPHVPTTHANFRYIERGEHALFGGGADLTPYVLYEDDARHFHRVLAGPCERFDPAFYPRFKQACDAYFYLPHRGEARGVGGLFFDDLSADEHHDPGVVGGKPRHSMDALLGWWREQGEAFLPAYLPIVERRRHLDWDEALRRWQLQRRGRYVEFNLLHDRGTRFGLLTGGRIESILMSLPPLVRWDYAVEPGPEPEPSTPEARLLAVLRSPRDWR